MAEACSPEACSPDELDRLLSRPLNQPLGQPVKGEHGYTRIIDKIFHIDYWNNIHKNKNKNGDMYFVEQQKIISILTGCEKQLLNDPTVNYPYRLSFRGITGTLTNLLTGGFFHIYLHALTTPGITVNVCVDLITVFDHVKNYISYDIHQKRFVLPDVEFKAIKQIIAILMKKKNKFPYLVNLFSKSWFERLKDVYSTTHANMIKKGQDTYYYGEPTIVNLSTFIVGNAYRDLFPRECELLVWRDNDIIGDYPNRPSYLDRFSFKQHSIPTGHNVELSEDAIVYFKKIAKLFNPGSPKANNQGGSRKKRNRKFRKTRRFQ
jgi:hypothetical protein